MKAKMTLISDDCDMLHNIYDWDFMVMTDKGLVKVSEISVFLHKINLNGVFYKIAHMLSAKSF